MGRVRSSPLSLPIIHRQIFRNLLLGAAAAGQLVQLVFHLAEALGHAVGCETGLGVVVPALVDGGTDDSHALTEERAGKRKPVTTRQLMYSTVCVLQAAMWRTIRTASERCNALAIGYPSELVPREN